MSENNCKRKHVKLYLLLVLSVCFLVSCSVFISASAAGTWKDYEDGQQLMVYIKSTLLGIAKNPDGTIEYGKNTDDNFYFKDGSAYKLSGQSPIMSYIPEKIDTGKYPLFKKVYRYSSDGKTLTDCTVEFLNADKVYRHRTPMLAITGKKVSLIDTAKYLDKNTAGWNWYRDMGRREYIAYDLDLTAIGNETPIRLFNTNILMTNCAFYEIVYASEPLDDNDKNAQTAPDGSVSPYYPAAPHLNCNLTLRKITLLTNYYKDVRNICTSHVITDDYTLLPISEIMTEGYAEYYKYDCNKFYSAYRDK